MHAGKMFLILFFGLSFADLMAQTGRDIMAMVDEREDGETRSSVIEMTLINKNGRTRVRNVISYQKDYGKDKKSLMYFTKPEDVKGTGFLSWEYEDQDKEDDKWLYMPALRKERRISGSSDKEYFMGTDFTYDDMGDRNVDEDIHKLVAEEEISGFDCWVVESIPKDESEYSSKKVWVRKDIAVVVKVDYYNKVGLMKTLNCMDIVEIDGIWSVRKMIMENIQTKHKTIMEISDIRFNESIQDTLFTVSALKTGRIR